MMDSWGFVGLVLDYAIIFFFSLATITFFIYFYKKGQLSFDESPKYDMLKEDK